MSDGSYRRPPRFLAPRVIGAMWRRELLRYARDPSQLFGGFSRTLLWLIILGFGLGATLREIEGYSYTQYILPGVVVLNVLFASLQSAFAMVYDRQHGLMRQILVSPAPMFSVTLGKVFGGATVAVVQGSIPLLFAPVVGIPLTVSGLLLAWAVMFAMGVSLTAVGIVIATRMRGFESFGSISNGVIQPLYFMSGSIFPLKGLVGGVGFLDIPQSLRDELRRHGIYAIGGGWVVQLPAWLEFIVRANPISYKLDLIRFALLGFNQLPMHVNAAVCLLFPMLAVMLAAWCVERLRQS